MEGNPNNHREDEMKELLSSIHEPASPSPEFKAKLLERLVSEAEVTDTAPVTWNRPERLMPVAAAIVAVVIGYGIWLSLTYPV